MGIEALSNMVGKVANEIKNSAPSIGGPRIAIDSLKLRAIIDSARSLSDPHNDLYRTLTKGVETVARQLPEAPAIVRTAVKIGNEIADVAEEVPVIREPAKQLAGKFTVLLELLKGIPGARELTIGSSQPQQNNESDKSAFMLAEVGQSL